MNVNYNGILHSEVVPWSTIHGKSGEDLSENNQVVKSPVTIGSMTRAEDSQIRHWYSILLNYSSIRNGKSNIETWKHVFKSENDKLCYILRETPSVKTVSEKTWYIHRCIVSCPNIAMCHIISYHEINDNIYQWAELHISVFAWCLCEFHVSHCVFCFLSFDHWAKKFKCLIMTIKNLNLNLNMYLISADQVISVTQNWVISKAIRTSRHYKHTMYMTWIHGGLHFKI